MPQSGKPRQATPSNQQSPNHPDYRQLAVSNNPTAQKDDHAEPSDRGTNTSINAQHRTRPPKLHKQQHITHITTESHSRDIKTGTETEAQKAPASYEG